MTDLPAGWRRESVAAISEGGLFSDGDWVESKDQDSAGSVRLTQLADVGIAEFRNRSNRWMREDQAAALNCTFLNPGDILVARMPDPLGRACMVPETIGRAVTAVDVAILRIARRDIDPRFVMWAINAPEFSAAVERMQSGTTRKRISRRNLASLLIPLPPVEEQRGIVEILEDHLSRLASAKASARTAARRIEAWRRSCLESLFGPNGRSTVPLGQLIDGIDAGKSAGGSAPPAGRDEWGVIKVSAMTWGEFRPDENKRVAPEFVHPRYEIRSGDLLVSRANTTEYVGASVMVRAVRPKLLLSDKSLRLHPRPGIRRDWLWRVLQSLSVRRQISAAATGTKDSMRNISQANLARVSVPDPSQVDQSAAISQWELCETAIRATDLALHNAVTRADNLGRSLLAAAFSGRLTASTAPDQLARELAESSR